MNFDRELLEKGKEVESVIVSFLPIEEGWAKTVLEAMNYSVCAGGKRLRPMLMAETYKLFGGKDKVIEPFMAAIEMIHTYSLVHDDLPAMDNDEYRRGRKTTWVMYGDAMAILAGDGLLNYAFETALKSFEMPQTDLERAAKALSILAKKAGIYGMIGGQTADIEAQNPEIRQLLYIYEHKTAALIQAAMMVGAVLAGANDDQVKIVEQAAFEIGIAFQIQDDILDVESTKEVLGKPIHSDEKNDKTTYVTLLGLEEAKKEVERLSDEAIRLLHQLSGENQYLERLLLWLVHRDR